MEVQLLQFKPADKWIHPHERYYMNPNGCLEKVKNLNYNLYPTPHKLPSKCQNQSIRRRKLYKISRSFNSCIRICLSTVNLLGRANTSSGYLETDLAALGKKNIDSLLLIPLELSLLNRNFLVGCSLKLCRCGSSASAFGDDILRSEE